MPNWCLVTIKIEGPRDSMDKFYESLNNVNLKNQQIEFSFNQLIPFPGNTDLSKWMRQNWGTDTDAKKIKIYQQRNNLFLFQYETANTPPIRWAQNASEILPELTFTVSYYQFENQFYGVDIINDSQEYHIKEEYGFLNDDTVCSECFQSYRLNEEDGDFCELGGHCNIVIPSGRLEKFLQKHHIHDDEGG